MEGTYTRVWLPTPAASAAYGRLHDDPPAGEHPWAKPPGETMTPLARRVTLARDTM